MTPRERILAAGVGLSVLLVVSLFAVQRLSNLFDRRHSQIEQLGNDIEKKRTTVKNGKRAQQKLSAYAERSLPPDRTLARSIYQDWLLERAVQLGFSGVNVSPVLSRTQSDVYFQNGFLFTGQGDLHELTQFLHAFYSAGYLHRVSRLSAEPIAKSKKLSVSITVEALSLNGAPPRENLPDVPGTRLMHEDLAKYEEAIVSRNMFSPANRPPQLSPLSTQTANPGRPVGFQVKASDPDQLDALFYSLGEPPLSGARIDPKSGEFQWTPDKLGEYEVSIRVSDNGLPAQSASQKVKIAVVEPPPPREVPPPAPGFDPAKHSILTGITEINGKWQAWITVRTESRDLKLCEGDSLSVGSVQGIISRIDASTAEIKTKDGKVVVVGLGKSLKPDTPLPQGSL